MPRALSSCPAAGAAARHPVAVPAGMPDEQREGLQEELIDIILHVLKRNPQLHYYQGYHDIVVTFLLVVGDRLATALVEKLSTHHLRYRGGREELLRAPGGLTGGHGGRGGCPGAWHRSLRGTAPGWGQHPSCPSPEGCCVEQRGRARARGLAGSCALGKG